MRLMFVHGWGFDAGFWQRLVAHVPGWGWDAVDRGYFGARVAPECAGPVLVVAHSFGAMQVLAAPPADCRGLVAINGFDRFVAGDGAAGVSARVIARMVARFAAEPGGVLGDFRQRCGWDAPFGALEPEILGRDLQALAEQDCRAQAAAADFPILSVQGGADPILPAAMRGAVFAGAGHVQRLDVAGGGHVLPLSAPQLCAEAIRRFAERLA